MTEEERELFYNSSINSLPEKWERMKWVKEKERQLNIEKVTTWEITRYLYHSGTYGYVNGNYASSILSIASAIDSFLGSIISADEFSKKEFLSVRIKKAEDSNKISPDMASELKNFNDKIRNHLVHPKGPFTHYLLGGEFDEKTGKWTKEFPMKEITIIKDGMIRALKMDPNANMRKVCEYSILLFMKTVRDHLNLKYGYSNLG
ncbi:MAG: hypothetical protein ACTSPJ_02780 [Candidatus Heimdallarchaeaceae archaeon]